MPLGMTCGGALPCCGLPFVRLEGEKLVIESRHKGEVHVNEISVGALGAMVR